MTICFYSIPFGPVPLELDETYPVAQTESLDPQDANTYLGRAELVGNYVSRVSPRKVVLACEGEYGEAVERRVLKILPRSRFVSVHGDGFRPDRLISVVEKTVNEIR